MSYPPQVRSNLSPSVGRSLLCVGAFASLVSLTIGMAEGALAQVVPDHTLGTEPSTITPNVMVNGSPADRVDGGALRGVNLFHSFSRFNIGEGQRVYFANPAGVLNILSRVTGTSRSDIFGTLGVLGNANLFLINPNGIVFGPNARLDIAGSFVASTASRFRFADGSEFSAVQPQAAPLLTVNLVPGLQYGPGQPGAAIANRGTLFAGQDLTLTAERLDLQGAIGAGRDLTLQATQSIQMRDTTSTPFVAAATRHLLVQGQHIDIFALNHPQSGFFSGGNMTLRSANPVGGDAHYWSGGNFRIEQMDGSPGTLFSPYDPVIRATGDVQFLNYQGTSLHILAGGSVTAGTIIITGTDNGAGTINPTQTPALANFNLSDGTPFSVDGSLRPTLDIRAGVSQSAIAPAGITGFNFPTDIFFNNIGVPIAPPAINTLASGSDIRIDQILFPTPTVPSGMVLLTNQFQPNLALPAGNITVTGTNLPFFPTAGIAISTGILTGGSGGSVTLDARGGINLGGTVDTSVFAGSAAGVRLIANGNIATGLIDTTEVGPVAGFQGGAINITSRAGAILVGTAAAPETLVSASLNGSGGAIALTAAGNITAGNILSGSRATGGNPRGGTISLTSQTGNIDTTAGQINSFAPGGQAGAIAVTAAGNITTGDINSDGLVSGAISLNAGGNFALGNGAILGSESTGTDPQARSGNVSITANTINITDGAQIQVVTSGATPGGNLQITARDRLLITGVSQGVSSGIFTSTEPGATANGGNLTIESPTVTVENGAVISVRTRSAGNAGNLTIIAANGVTVVGGAAGNSVIFTQAQAGSTGNAGNLEIRTGRLSVQAGGQIDSSTLGSGNGGRLTVVAPTIELTGGSTLASSTVGTASGRGGTVELQTDRLIVRDGSQVGAGTFGTGAGGRLIVSARDRVLVTGTGPVAPSGLFTTAEAGSTGNAGDTIITTPQLQVLDGARISASTQGSGKGGEMSITSDQLTVANNGRVSAASFNTGDAGNLTIRTGQLLVQGGGQVDTSTFGAGNGGRLSVFASTIELVGTDVAVTVASNLGSNTVGLGGGRGGTVQLETDRLTVRDGAQVGAGTFGAGEGGRLIVNARDRVLVTGTGPTSPSALFTAADDGSTGNAGDMIITTPQLQVLDGSRVSTATASTGRGGDLSINSRQLTVQNNAQVSAASSSTGTAGSVNITSNAVTVARNGSINVSNQGSGSAGDLNVTAGSIFLSDRGSLIAETTSGQGGNVALQVSDVILMRRNSLISTTAGTAQAGGDGGNIRINAPFVLAVRSENSDIRANAFTGRGGRVEITAQGVFGLQFQPRDTPQSDITASSEFGLSGDVILNILNVDPSRGLTALPTNLVDATGLIAQQCPGSGGTANQQSSFTITGRGGLPPTPTEPLSSDAVWQDLQWYGQGSGEPGVRSQRSGEKGNGRIVEAVGWVVEPDGRMALVHRGVTRVSWFVPPECLIRSGKAEAAAETLTK